MPKKSGKDKKKKKDKTAVKKGLPPRTRESSLEKLSRLKPWVEETAPLIMVIVVALLLFIGPFHRGLFFTPELLMAQAVVFGLLVVWGCFRLATGNGRLIESPLDICLFLLLLAYILSFFVAVHRRDALEELLKIASYLVVYLASIEICRHFRLPRRKMGLPEESAGGGPDVREQAENAGQNPAGPNDSAVVPPGLKLLLHLALAAAVVVTLASLGAAAGHWDIRGAYDASRIGSPMGYANTAAAYLMAAYLLAVGLAPLAGRWLKLLYLAPASLMLITVILTFSRGAWLLLPFLGLLLVLVAAPGERLRSGLYLAVTAAAAVPAAFTVDPALREGLPGRAWAIMIGAVLITVLLGWAAELYLAKSRRFQLRLAAATAVILAAAFFALVVLPATGPVQLEKTAGEAEETQSVEQQIRAVAPGETYTLRLDVNAELDPSLKDDPPRYVWAIRVLEGVEGYRYNELMRSRGPETVGWEEKEFTFTTGDQARLLEVHLYNRYPGTSFTARNVKLSTEEKEQSLNFTLNRMLPDRFYYRLFSASLDRNLERRFDFYRDAVKIIKDYPVLGAGGGGWNALYRSYQDIGYSSSEVHNHFLQVWIEAGLVGFLAFTGIWISFAAAFIRSSVHRRAPAQIWQYWTACFMPVVALGAHSVIDWNFSLAAVGIFLAVLLGAGRSLDYGSWFRRLDINSNRSGKSALYVGIAAIVAGLLLLVYSLLLLTGLNATWRAQALADRGNFKQAIAETEKAMRLDPLRADNYHNLSLLTEERVRRTEIPADVRKMLSMAERAHQLEPYNPLYANRYGELLLQYVDPEKGLDYIDRIIELRPRFKESYLHVAFVRLELAEFALQRGMLREAALYLAGIMELEQIMEEQHGDSRPLAFVLGRANFLFGDRDRAAYYYGQVGEKDEYYDAAQSELEQIQSER